MKFPKLAEQPTSRSITDVFAGYNHNLRIGDGEFYDEENMCSDNYPLLSVRRQRGVYASPAAPQGLIAKDALCYVDGSKFVINGRAIEMDLSTAAAKCPKSLISMGAYVIIMPDKKYINTVETNDRGSIEASYQSMAGGRFSLCTAEGAGVEAVASAAAPEKPSNGAYWLDTSGEKHTLKVYSSAAGIWTSVATTYVKISATGIGAQFGQYDGVTIAGITKKAVKDLNGSAVIWSKADDYIVVVGLLDAAVEQTAEEGAITVKRTMPDMDFVVESGNRLWGCKYGVADGETVNEIYCCKLGDFKNWECYQGVSTDSWRASCGTDGKWTGAATLADSPVFFKEDCFHRVYPSATGAHQVVVQKCAGVQNGSSKSMVVVDDQLYYKSRMGVCVYDGSLPQEIGSCFGTKLYYNAVAGGARGKYFISMEDEGHNWSLFVYDTRKGLWHREDATHAEAFARVDDELYFLEDGTLRTVYGSVGTLEDSVQWMAETGIMTYGLVGKKYVSRINLRMQLPKGSSVDFWVQYDSDGVWRHCGHIEGRGLRTFLLPIRPARCDHLKFRLTGKGEMKLFSLARVLEAGSDA